ncbi:uncharacterized protein DS421_9g272110 [Arachis hypogaea]|nr:uncharacterized protein DS421_9g272110 [Arachis hypogaea]
MPQKSGQNKKSAEQDTVEKVRGGDRRREEKRVLVKDRDCRRLELVVVLLKLKL